MTRKFTRNAGALRGIAPFIAVLTALIALAALAQTGGVGQASGKRDQLVTPLVASGPGTGDAGPILLERFQGKRLDTGAVTMYSNSPLFLPAVAYDSGGSDVDGFVTSVAVADVNGDGKPDLAATNGSSNTVGVLLGNGDGTFQPAVTYNPGGQNPTVIRIADLNGDGKPDLVVGIWGGGVGVLLGNGDGSFQPAVTYGSGGVEVADVVVADVNLDGKPDLIVANYGSALGVLVGNGDGTFKPAVTYGGGRGPYSVVVADVNDDGKPDLLVANYIFNTVAVVLGNGDGTFKKAVTYGSGGALAVSIAVADVNGDNRPDLVVMNCGTNNCPNSPGSVAVLLGNGDGTFQAAVPHDSGGALGAGVAIADVNGDGKLDLVAANGCTSIGCSDINHGLVGVLLGNGDGTFQPVVTYGSGGGGPSWIVAADVNGDGNPDLVVKECGADCGSGRVGVLLSNAAPRSPTTTTVASNLNPATTGKVVTYTAAVTSQEGKALTRSVMFQDGGSTVATVPLTNNQASYSTTYTKGGTHAIAATYSGDPNNAASTSATLLEHIAGITSKTVVTTSGSPSLIHQPVTFTATVTPAHGTIPDGELVTFSDGPTPLGSVALAGGTAAFTTASLSVKTHTIKAAYAGDAMFKPSTGFVTQVVNKYPTTTTLTSSPNPSHSGQSVTFTAKVTSTGPAPTGKVKFLDGTLAIGSATLSGGVAKLSKSTLAVGTHPITAQYLGDSASAKSTSSVVNQVVQ